MMSASRPQWRYLLLAALVLSATMTTGANDSTTARYRGNYTLGHETNSFCPDINSQCYWLHPGTGQNVRQALRTLVEQHSTGLDEPVCLIVEGRIDRDSPRSGFAADYNGLMVIDKVYGECKETDLVTQGDLQHHRWILTAVDGEPVSRAGASPHSGPSLEIGERLFFEVHDATESLNGFARLDGEKILFTADQVRPARYADSADSAFRASTLAAGPWVIRITEGHQLQLESDATRLEFTLDDWR